MSESKVTNQNQPWDLGGEGIYKDDQTVLQDAGRSTVLAFLTVMAKKQSE